MDTLSITLVVLFTTLSSAIALMTILSYCIDTSCGVGNKKKIVLLEILIGSCLNVAIVSLMVLMAIMNDTAAILISVAAMVSLLIIKKIDKMKLKWRKKNSLFYNEHGYLTNREKCIWWVIFVLCFISLILNIG